MISVSCSHLRSENSKWKIPVQKNIIHKFQITFITIYFYDCLLLISLCLIYKLKFMIGTGKDTVHISFYPRFQGSTGECIPWRWGGLLYFPLMTKFHYWCFNYHLLYMNVCLNLYFQIDYTFFMNQGAYTKSFSTTCLHVNQAHGQSTTIVFIWYILVYFLPTNSFFFFLPSSGIGAC